jgi:hypothetical protein
LPFHPSLAATNLPYLALDLRRLPKSGPVKRWFNSPQGTWRIVAIFNPETTDSYIEKEAITSEYDALFFVSHTTAAKPVPYMASDMKAAVNLGFEEGLAGWSNPDYPGYQTQVTEQGVKQGTRALQVSFVGVQNPNAWWKVDQTIDAASYRGKKVRFTGWIRTDGKPGFKARLWLRLDRKNGPGFYDNMQQRPVTATDWTEVTIEGPVTIDAVNLTFGCTVMGEGTAWFDGLSLEYSETGICHGLGKHGDADETRGNKRSPWDTLHPGRTWAANARNGDRFPEAVIRANLKAHFAAKPP